MFSELLDTKNYLFINIPLINILGLEGAVYCSEIFTISNKAKRKNQLVDKYYVKIDREYIQQMTSIDFETQAAIEDKLIQMDLLAKHPTKPNNFEINLEGFAMLIAKREAFTEAEINKIKDKVRIKTPEEIKTRKAKGILKQLKADLTFTDSKVNEKMCEFMDALYEAKKLVMTKNMFTNFCTVLEKYGRGNSEKMIGVIDTAINNLSTDCAFMIKRYEESLPYTKGTISEDRATSEEMKKAKRF